MSERSEQLRRQGQRIFWYSMLAAVAIHVVIFVASPEFKTQPLAGGEAERQEKEGDVALGKAFVDVYFAPPEIVREDGTIWKEPPNRVLEARAVDFSGLDVSFECGQKPMESVVPLAGRVRIVLNAGGRAVEFQALQRTDDRCDGEVLEAILSKVTYEWLPNETFPAPVELTQPLRVVATKR